MKLPTYAMIEIGWNCNLSCFMCPRYGAGYDMGNRPNMTLEQHNCVLDQLHSLKSINYAGCLEPVTNPHFFDMIKEATDRNLVITMTSNGLLWSKENIEKLPKDKSIFIHISIDSPLPELYEEYRGVKLSRVLENLGNFNRLRPNVQLTIQPLLMRETLPAMDKIVPIARRYNARLSPIYPICFSKELEDKLSPFYLDNYDKMVEHLHTIARHFGVYIWDKPAYPTPKDCNEPWIGPTISVKGEIYPCCYSYEARRYSDTPSTWDEYYNRERITVPQENYVMGNIFKDKLIDVWNSDNYNKLRENLVECRKHEKSRNFTKDDYLNIRKDSNLKDKFDYCSICLWRWNQSC